MTPKMNNAKQNWKWFGNAGHFICADDCRFHLTTHVGKYLVSTVGQLWPVRSSREIHAKVHDPKWLAENRDLKGDEFDFHYRKRFGYHEIGCGRTFETMVFRAGKPCEAEGCRCGLPRIDGSELDFLGYNDAASATRGHLSLCEKWSRPTPAGFSVTCTATDLTRVVRAVLASRRSGVPAPIDWTDAELVGVVATLEAKELFDCARIVRKVADFLAASRVGGCGPACQANDGEVCPICGEGGGERETP